MIKHAGNEPFLILFRATEHLNSCENKPVLSSRKNGLRKKYGLCENQFFTQNSSSNFHNMETWEKRTPFSQNSSLWLFLYFCVAWLCMTLYIKPRFGINMKKLSVLHRIVTLKHHLYPVSRYFTTA